MGTGGNQVPIIIQDKKSQAVFEPADKGICIENHRQDARWKIAKDNVSPTLDRHMGTGGNNTPFILQPETYCIAGNTIDRKIENGGNGKGVKEEVSFTLNTIDRHAITFPSISYSEFTNSNKASTLKACGGVLGGGSENLAVAKNQHNYKVRRLTPTECERLQGYPDGWTKDIEIKYPNHTETQIVSDSARYKALGNSVAVPCVQFVMSGIARELKKEVEEDERG